ncbi:unnamed protein product, partial [Adineta ricciae]
MQDENKIGYARQSMVLFLKSLPLNSYFNIIRFGSSYKPLFDQATVVYNEENSKKAEKLVENMQADLGGTELLNPMKWLEEHPAQEGRSRQIFLLTDGEISNVDEVLNLCRSMSKSSRIFSFGLGQSPSRSLVKGLARSTNGRFCFIPPSTKVDTYVGQQLEKALQPSITNLEIKWNLPIEIATAPKVLPPVYANDRLIIYGLINDPTIVFDHQIRIELFNNQQKLSEATITQIPAIIQNQTISRLAGKALILELQHSKLPSIPKGSRQTRFRELNQQSIDKQQEEQRERIINLSLKYQILSPHTSFIGIEKRLNGNNEQMVLREVPIQLSADDQHLVKIAPTNGAFMQCALPMGASVFDVFNSRASLNPCYDSTPLHHHSMLSPCFSYPVSQCCVSPLLSDVSRLHYAKRKACAYDEFEIDEKSEEKFPNDDENIVRYLIDKQNFDGLWNLDSEIIEKLTGKPL